MKIIYSVFSINENENHSAGTFSQCEYFSSENESECKSYIESILKDYKNRNVGNGERFYILPTYCLVDGDLSPEDKAAAERKQFGNMS